MSIAIHHELGPSHDADAAARGRFVSAMRGFILNDLASDLKHAFDTRAAPAFENEHGRAPQSSDEAHEALMGDPAFSIYSAMRVRAQRMVWETVGDGVERDAEAMEAIEAKNAGRPGSLTLDHAFAIPRNVDGIDVHLMPGSYTRGAETLEAGAVYDRGLAVFSMGLMGEELSDIGQSMAAWVKANNPDFAPRDVLDLGCTVGHNTLPWKEAFPQARVTGIDAAPGGLRYAAARAKAMETEAHFRQMDASYLKFADGSFDLVFSSMFLHELPAKARAKVLEEARRVLRPGGLMLHMELPPNDRMGPFEGFYLDWDSHYNAEPYYKSYRDEDPKALCTKAGFAEEDYVEFVVPSLGIYGLEAIKKSVSADIGSQTTGRLADGVMWFGFGAWKR